jgi:hypothetical protein
MRVNSVLSLGDVHPDVGGRSTSLWLMVWSSGGGGGGAVGVGDDRGGCMRWWG